MQINQPNLVRRRIIVFTALFVVAALLLCWLLGLFNGGSRTIGVTRLRCVSTQDVTPFGGSVLYYDDNDLFCLNARGVEKWHYTLGPGASFHAGNRYVAAWVGTKLCILDQNGTASYDSQLSDVIQFARAGDQYIAVVTGQNTSPTLVIKDIQGITVDTEATAYQDMLMLDMGFFSEGDYLWTTSLDVYGTVPGTTMHTFRVGQMNTGEANLGEALVYKIIYAGGELNVISTRQLRQYDYRGTLDSTGTVLVYGWQVVDSAVSGSRAQVLFGRTNQTDDMTALTDLRLLSGGVDRRFTLPNTCVGAAVYNNRVYAFSEKTLYRADVSGQRFDAINLPVGGGVTGYIGLLKGGVALLTSDSEVYAVTLP